jgi:hypothetical protein
VSGCSQVETIGQTIELPSRPKNFAKPGSAREIENEKNPVKLLVA